MHLFNGSVDEAFMEFLRYSRQIYTNIQLNKMLVSIKTECNLYFSIYRSRLPALRDTIFSDNIERFSFSFFRIYDFSSVCVCKS